MESGRVRKRRTYIEPLEVWDVSWNFTEDQFVAFKSFFELDLENGSLPFDITLLGEDKSMAFLEGGYSFSRSDNLVAVVASLEVITSTVTPVPPTPITDDEVDDWADVRVPAQGGTVSPSVKEAAAVFMTAIKAVTGLRAKIKRCGVYAGTPLVALKAPLIKDWGTLTDFIGVNWLDADYSEATGLANAALRNAFINTGLNPLTIGVDVNDWHMSCYVRTPATEITAVMGGQAFNAGTASTYLLVSYTGVGSVFEAWSGADQIVQPTDPNGVGFYVGTRRSATDIALYKNGTSIASSATTGGTAANNNIGVHTYTNGGSNAAPTDRALSFYSIGLGLTPEDITALTNAVATLQTTLGRNV